MEGPPFSIVIPAHNEERVIGDCLRAILRDAPAGARPEIIIAANGCSDRTVDIARAVAPSAIVLDLPAGSKVIAMNAANLVARVAPRFMIDADVITDYGSLLATADVLRGSTVMVAAPRLQVNLEGCSQFVRSYYRVWMTQPYVRDAMVGSGLFGLSNQGLLLIGEIPPTFGDDAWVRSRFPREQRQCVSRDADGKPTFFVVRPPRDLWDHVKIEARRRIGSEQVNRLYPSSDTGQVNHFSDLASATKAGATLIDVAIYLLMKGLARVVYRWKQVFRHRAVWLRDERSRVRTSIS